MIIIATDEEKENIEHYCTADCDECMFNFLTVNGNCPIENRQIVVVDKEKFTNCLIREE